MKKIKALMAAGAMTVLAVGLAPSAQAADNSLLITKNGEWKAYGYVNMDQRRICVRVYNSVPGAWASMSMYQGGYNVGAPLDFGGDTQNQCGWVGYEIKRGWATLQLSFKPVNGQIETKTVYTYVS